MNIDYSTLTIQPQNIHQQLTTLMPAHPYLATYLDHLTHELRAPLNVLLILSQSLAANKEGNLNAQQVQYAQFMQQAGKDLLQLVNDLLDHTLMSSGKMNLHITHVSLPQLVQECKYIYQILAQEKKLEFTIEYQTDGLKTVQSDGQKIKQILINLLANAFKFTSEGHIILRVHPTAISVIDTGRGMTEAQIQQILNSTLQQHVPQQRPGDWGGSGLGLAISRQLAQELGGEIHISSTVGQGSCFTLCLPEAF